MKQLLSILLLIVFGTHVHAQNVGIGTNTPDSSALLELNSSSKGFLPPRLTTAQRNGISNPAVGLMIYNTSSDCLEIFGKGKWNPIYCVPADTTVSTTVIDIDGNVYPTVNICNQTWMAKNLDVARYRNGDIIPQVTDPTQWANLTTGAWCWYNNDSATYGPTYGRLYNWYAVNDPRGLAPAGWHVSNDAEWNIMTKCLDETVDTACNLCYSGNTIGTQLRTITGWNGGGNGTNSSGFSGLPSGARQPNGTFFLLGSHGNWWNSTEFDAEYAWSRYMFYGNNNIFRIRNHVKTWGFSVRCVKDAPPPSTLDSGLVAFYPFNGNADDASGNGNHGVVNGATLTSDRFGNSGKAYGFDGVDDNIQMYTINLNDNNKNIAVSVWFNGADYGSWIKYIVAKNFAYTSMSESLSILVNNAFDNLVGLYADSTGNAVFNDKLNTPISIQSNRWMHACYLIDQSNNSTKLFLNGMLVGQKNLTSRIYFDNGPWSVGCEYENGILDYFFNGKLDDIRIYNRALTQEEVSYLSTH